jgi:pimeloyl-ACP methyl ester carboxylesterase
MMETKSDLSGSESTRTTRSGGHALRAYGMIAASCPPGAIRPRPLPRPVPMPMEFVLVPGPMVRASGLEPAARHLRELGYRTQLLDVLAYKQTPPAWNEWISYLLALIDASIEAVLVGHSSASVLVADLAATLPCQCLIMVDGEVPPSKETVVPIRSASHDPIRSLARSDESLPVWSRWGDERRAALVGLDILARDPAR